VNIKGHISSFKLIYQLVALIQKKSDFPGIIFGTPGTKDTEGQNSFYMFFVQV
jgi:hypothetical protein